VQANPRVLAEQDEPRARVHLQPAKDAQLVDCADDEHLEKDLPIFSLII
jgi:hypothetical protein